MDHASNNKNLVIKICVVKQYQSDQPMFVPYCPVRNVAVYKGQTSLPNIDRLTELVATYQVWSKIDLADGYFDIRVKQGLEKWNTVLATHGKMRSHVISQGDDYALGTIIEAMLDIFKDVVYLCLVIYINDIIIYYGTYEEHVTDLRKVIQGLEEQNVYLKESNCHFFPRKREILAHMLISEGLHVDPKQRKTILEVPTPTRKKD